MKIVIKTTNIKLTFALHQYIEEKINSLEKFLKIFEKEKYWNHFFGKGKARVEAWVEIGKETRHHQKGPFFRAECQMRLPGKSIRSEARQKDLRLAIDEVKDELQRELKQYKNKMMAKIKRSARVHKKSLKLHPAAKIKREKGARIREEGI